MTLYRERLGPNAGLLVAGLLFIPAILLALTPISFALAVPVSIAFYAAFVAFLFGTSPVIVVTPTSLQAGRATIGREHLASAAVIDELETRSLLTTRADARAHLVIRSWIRRSVQVTLNDENDATPYWLITSRNPEELARVLNS